jgi:hypothetical protein
MNSKSEKFSLIINSNSLICCLYTLSNRKKNLKRNLKKDIYLHTNSKRNYFLADLKQLDELSKLLNNLALRRFAYRLIKPLVNKTNIYDICDETILLKKYLRKFKYNYHLYFFCQNVNHEFWSTDKEINMSAIKSLFFLVGI